MRNSRPVHNVTVFTAVLRSLVGSVAALVVFASCAFPAAAQDIGSASDSLYWSGDSLVTRAVNGRSQSMLMGARLRQGATSIRADTGVDEGDGIFSFRGNVRIVEMADTIDAPFVRYDRNTKIGRASGGVRLSDGTVVVRSPAAVHDSERERTEFEDGVVYEDSAAVLSADTAIYFSSLEQVDFRGDVRLEQDSTRVFADSLRYFRDSEESTAFGRVAVVTEQASRSTTLFADRLERYADRDSTVAAGGAFLRTVTRPEGGDDEAADADTLFVVSGAMMLSSIDVERLIARDSVRVVSGRFSSLSDSLIHERTDSASTSRFTGSPVAWVRRTQIRADTILTTGDGRAIRRITGRGGVFVASFDSLTGRIQQISGRGLTARLRRDTLRSILVGPNARGIFFQERSREGGTSSAGSPADSAGAGPDVGATVASADSLRLYFSGGDVDSLAFVGDVEGSFYSPNLVSRVSDLDGYVWTPELEPDIHHIRMTFREELSRRVLDRASSGDDEASASTCGIGAHPLHSSLHPECDDTHGDR